MVVEAWCGDGKGIFLKRHEAIRVLNYAVERIGAKRAHSIMIIDGEPLTRLLLADYLMAHGYRVHEASSAASAKGILGVGVKVDLVFADIAILWDEDAADLVQFILHINPDVKTILTSDIHVSVRLSSDPARDVEVMSKPYDIFALERRMAELLADRPF